jgi:hypothetical protein
MGLMAHLPDITGVSRVALKWAGPSGQTAVNVIHVLDNAPSHTPAQMFTVLDAHVTASMWASMVDGAGVYEVDITPLDGITATQSFAVTGTPDKWSGTESGEFVPQVAALIKLTTAVRGRSSRGRVFLPFTAEGITSAGNLSTGAVGTIQSAWDAFRAAIHSASPSFDLVVASYKLSTAELVLNSFCELQTATQRRRQERNRP